MKHHLVLIWLMTVVMMLASAAYTTAQTKSSGIKVSGKVVDSRDRQPLIGATAFVTPTNGGKPQAQGTDANGQFSIVNLRPGTYDLKIVFVGYANYEKKLTLKSETPEQNLGTIRLKAEDLEIEEVKAVGTMVRQEQRGDTTVFNAAAFKVNPDATTEDLLKKVPGMQVKDGSVTHGGETVKKVLVDGKEFFGSDPMLALKNIDANMVDKIEVYDKQSDQSEFTGFSDGNEERTINILTKMGIKKGFFGRLYGGYGTDEHYEGGGNLNCFVGEHRFSLIGMSNNVNQQNFSFDDVTGAMSNGGGRSMRGMGGSRGGINTTSAIGFNYNFERDKKLRVEASYFYNYNKNRNNSSSAQEYFRDNEEDSLRTYNSESESRSHNRNHRVNLRLRWTINENNSLIFRPQWSWQGYDGNSTDTGTDALDSIPYKLTQQKDESETTGYSLGMSLTWRHKFSLPRRTISLSVDGSANNSDSDADAQSGQSDLGTEQQSLFTSQLTTNESRSSSVSAKLMYTEPFGDHLALQVNYNPSYSYSKGDKMVNADSVNTTATSLVDLTEFSNYRFSSLLSNLKESEYLIHRAGVGLNFFKDRLFNATVGLDFQHSTLDGDQTYPYSFETHKTFSSIMPSAELRVNKDKAVNLRLTYRTSSKAPSITQLQNVVDVSNVRKYSAGNQDLDQSTTHNVRLFAAFNNMETSRFLFMMANVQVTKDYISTASMIATQDSLIDNGIILPKGTQLSKPINMDGFISASFNITLSSPVKWLGSNVSLNLGANLQKKPSQYNYKEVTNKTYALSGGLNIGSSFSENIDFNVGYDANYNIVKSTQTAANNYNYYNHTVRADLNCLFINQRLVFNTALNHKYTHGMGEDYDVNYLSWNAALGAKLLKDRRAELRLRVNDILNNAESTSRSIQDAYVQTSQQDVLRRYAMLTFTYKFKNIGNQNAKQSDGPRGPMPPMGGRREGGPMGGPGGGPGGPM